MNIEVMLDLQKEGVLTEMYKSGFLSCKVVFYMEVYLWVDAQMKARQISKNKAVLEAEIKFNVDENTIWRILKRFSG